MQIIDGFTLNNAKPIDDRIVTSGTASRDAIAYKYNGLRVYDIDAKQPYVWNGTIWTSENTSTVTITGTTTMGYIPVFNSTSQISNSLVSQVDSGVAKYVNIANGNAAYALRVNGVVVADSGFEGSGGGLTNLKGENIIGSIDVSKIKPKTSPESGQIYILKSGVSTPEWTKLSEIPATAIPTPAPISDNQSTTAKYVSFASTTGGNSYYQTAGGDAFKFVPRVNGSSEGAQLQIPNGGEANPSLAFSTNTSTGIYRAGWNILGISSAGKEKMRITENGVLVKSTAISESTLKVQNSGGRPFVSLYGLNGDSKMSGTIGFSGLWNNGGAPLPDLIIENFAGDASKTYMQTTAHFDANVPAPTDGRRHMINMNGNGQTIIATNIGSRIYTFENGVPGSPNSAFTNGAYGCDIYNSNPSMGHGLIVRSGGGPNTVSARFDNGAKTIAYFTDRGLQIMSGSETAPSICFDSDKGQSKNTGFFLESTGKIGIVANNKKVLTISDTEIKLSKVSNLAYIFGDNTRIEGTTRTNSLEIYRPTTNGGYAICHFYSDIGGTKAAKAYIWPDGTYYRLSDRNQKENIKGLEYGLNEVLRLNPVTHTWLYSDSTKPSIGLIAQEVEDVLKELVNTSMDGDMEIKALDYNGLIPVLIKSIQELNKKIEILESK